MEGPTGSEVRRKPNEEHPVGLSGAREAAKEPSRYEEPRDLLELLGIKKVTKREIIYASICCLQCRNSEKYHGSYMRCLRHQVRLVKPFYGKAIWTEIKKENGEKEKIVADIDWATKWLDVPEDRVVSAMRRANGGQPYDCFEPKEQEAAT